MANRCRVQHSEPRSHYNRPNMTIAIATYHSGLPIMSTVGVTRAPGIAIHNHAGDMRGIDVLLVVADLRAKL